MIDYRYAAISASLALVTAFSGFGQDTSFQVKRMKEWNENARDGRCILRVMVDDEVDVELQRDTVLIRRITGQPGRDDGSECTQPLPQSYFTRFAFRGIDGRGEVRLTQEPRPGNAFTAIVTIRDLKRGQEGYTFELSWTTDGQPYQGSVGGRDIRGAGGFLGAGTAASSIPTGGILPSLKEIGASSGTGASVSTVSQAAIAGLNETSAGTGSLRIGSQNEALRRVRVALESNGEMEIQFYGSQVVTLRGKWVARPGVVDLEVREGPAGAASSGSGRIRLNQDGGLDSVEVQGRLDNSQESYEIRCQKGR
jgi:hypothetical protein